MPGRVENAGMGVSLVCFPSQGLRIICFSVYA